MDKAEKKAKKHLEEAKGDELANTLREFAKTIDSNKNKSEKEKYEAMASTVLAITRKSVRTIDSAHRAEQAYHKGRDLSEEVIKKKSNTARWGTIPQNREKITTFANEYKCNMCDYTHKDIKEVRMHVKVFHENTDARVRWLLFAYIRQQAKI